MEDWIIAKERQGMTQNQKDDISDYDTEDREILADALRALDRTLDALEK